MGKNEQKNQPEKVETQSYEINKRKLKICKKKKIKVKNTKKK